MLPLTGFFCTLFVLSHSATVSQITPVNSPFFFQATTLVNDKGSTSDLYIAANSAQSKMNVLKGEITYSIADTGAVVSDTLEKASVKNFQVFIENSEHILENYRKINNQLADEKTHGDECLKRGCRSGRSRAPASTDRSGCLTSNHLHDPAWSRLPAK